MQGAIWPKGKPRLLMKTMLVAMMSQNSQCFEVCPVTSKHVISEYVMGYCQKLEWKPGKMDDELCWVAGPDGAGVYVGELNGEKITGISVIQHGGSYGYGGVFYCEEEHRGKWYSFKTLKTALAAVDPNVNIGCDAIPSAARMYERVGFKKFWRTTYEYLIASSILDMYSNMAVPSGVSVKPAASVNFSKLKLYAEDVVGFTFGRPGLLEKWITLPTHTAMVAIDDNTSDIVGFATFRETVNLSQDGYVLAPLLADNVDIACFLLLMSARMVESTQKFFAGLLHTNTFTKKLETEVQTEWGFDTVRMYTKEELSIKTEKYFATFSPSFVG